MKNSWINSPLKTFQELQHDSNNEWSYYNKAILAPMVRMNTLPLRLLARAMGADVLYSEELIAQKLKKCQRIENKQLNCIQFLNNSSGNNIDRSNNDNQQVIFSTYSNEPVVLQLGVSNSVDAIECGNIIANDVKAIDINCGCPKHFSLQGGMGAALLSKPVILADILSSLKRNFNVAITCKIRLLDDLKDTVELIRRIESCGVAAIGIHARRIIDRPRHKALAELVPGVIDNLSVPIIYNGDIFYNHEIEPYKARSKAHSVMIARGAQWNASIFNTTQAMLPVWDIVNSYLNYSDLYNHGFSNTKYCVLEMLKHHVGHYKPYQLAIRSKSNSELREALHSIDQYIVENKQDNILRGSYEAPAIKYETRPALSTAQGAAQYALTEIEAMKSKKEMRKAKRRQLQLLNQSNNKKRSNHINESKDNLCEHNHSNGCSECDQ
jgi:tRNA-dihydrouridine synthase 2